MRLEMVHLAHDNVETLGWQVIARSLRFARKYDLHVNPNVLFANVGAQMLQQTPNMLVLAAVRGTKVVGHLLAEVQEQHGGFYVMVTQLEIDKHERDGRAEVIAEGWKKIRQWANGLGVKKIRAWARNQGIAAIFEELGFGNHEYQFLEYDAPEE